MREFLFQIAGTLYRAGGVGLLIMGALDSSILFVPLGNDLLLIAMVARENSKLPWYAALATLGSLLGTFVIYVLARKGGEKGMEKGGTAARLEYIRKRVEQRAAWVLTFAALMPPPFPYKLFVAAAAALQYPRRKLMALTAGARFVRFSAEGLLAVYFGTRILEIGKSAEFQYGIAALIVVSLTGSAFSIYKLIHKSRQAAGTPPAVR